jgi:hypothetical protein
LEEIKEDHLSKVDSKFRDVSAEELIESSEGEFVDNIIQTAVINKTEIDLEDWEAEPKGSGGNRYLKVSLRVSGDVDLLEITPSGYDIETEDSDSSDSPVGTPTLDGQKLIFTFSLSEKEPSEIEEEIDETIEEIREGVEALHEDIEQANEEIRKYATKKYRERKDRAESTEEKLDDLDIPIKDRDQ